VRLNRRLTSAVAGAAKRQGPVERRISNTVRCAACDASFDAHDVAPEGKTHLPRRAERRGEGSPRPRPESKTPPLLPSLARNAAPFRLAFVSDALSFTFSDWRTHFTGPESPVQKMSRKTATNVFISVPMSVLGLFGVGKNSRRNPNDISMYEYMYDEESPGHMNYHSGVADKLASEHCNLD